mmetsp:Transcript_16299/g.41318  ORF Transcript_16299/g.41318 Transcript_16299/m.41318 type:complete len:983 (+) Transcript_16299:44-2992(+)
MAESVQDTLRRRIQQYHSQLVSGVGLPDGVTFPPSEAAALSVRLARDLSHSYEADSSGSMPIPYPDFVLDAARSLASARKESEESSSMEVEAPAAQEGSASANDVNSRSPQVSSVRRGAGHAHRLGMMLESEQSRRGDVEESVEEHGTHGGVRESERLEGEGMEVEVARQLQQFFAERPGGDEQGGPEGDGQQGLFEFLGMPGMPGMPVPIPEEAQEEEMGDHESDREGEDGDEEGGGEMEEFMQAMRGGGGGGQDEIQRFLEFVGSLPPRQQSAPALPSVSVTVEHIGEGKLSQKKIELAESLTKEKFVEDMRAWIAAETDGSDDVEVFVEQGHNYDPVQKSPEFVILQTEMIEGIFEKAASRRGSRRSDIPAHVILRSKQNWSQLQENGKRGVERLLAVLESDDVQAMTNEITLFFSNISNLAFGFVDDTNGRGVKFDVVKKVYSRIQEVTASKLPTAMETMSSALSELLNTQDVRGWEKKIRTWLVDDALVPVAAALLLNPLLMDPTEAEGRLFWRICQVVTMVLNRRHRAILASWLAKLDVEDLLSILHNLQQFITLRTYNLERVDERVLEAVLTLRVVYAANELTYGSTLAASIDKSWKGLEKFEVPVGVRAPGIGRKEFWNDGINDAIEKRWIDLPEDFVATRNYDSQRRRSLRQAGRSEKDMSREMDLLSVLPGTITSCAFILDEGSRSALLQYESTIEMRMNMHNSHMMRMLGNRSFEAPIFRLKVRREYLVEDSLHQLVVNMDNLRKPLRVEFVGEEGIDDGGLRKEWFQLLVKRLFLPEYGMLTFDDEKRQFWFNPDSFEEPEKFKLMGWLFGLAIFNSVIIELKFPTTLFKLLSGLHPSKLTLDDLSDVHPQVAKGLRELLEFEGDVENTFSLDFQVTREVFGATKQFELKENGATTPVTKENREEYVNLCIQYYLYESVKNLFQSFKHGFDEVCRDLVWRLFAPEEVELLVCGSPVLDFKKLEGNTKYDG